MWRPEHWKSYSEKLLSHLRDEEQKPTLEYETVKRVMSDFQDLRKDVKLQGTELLFDEVMHDRTNVSFEPNSSTSNYF